MDVLILLGSFALLAALGVPVAYALGLSAITGALWAEIPLEAVMIKMSDGVDEFALLAIPFFVLAGGIMAEGGMAARLILLAKVFVGFIRGGLALVNILASTLFGCVSGSSCGSRTGAAFRRAIRSPFATCRRSSSTRCGAWSRS